MHCCCLLSPWKFILLHCIISASSSTSQQQYECDVTLCSAGCRSPPNIYFKKKKTGGVSINSTMPLTKLDDKLIQRILQEYKIHNCEVLTKPLLLKCYLPTSGFLAQQHHEPCDCDNCCLDGSISDKMFGPALQLLFKEDCTVDDLIDVIEGNRRYVKCLYVYNKVTSQLPCLHCVQHLVCETEAAWCIDYAHKPTALWLHGH